MLESNPSNNSSNVSFVFLQPYGEIGRIGSMMHSWDDNLVVCGGYSGSGPPFSSFKDCLNFNLNNRWVRESRTVR